MPKWWLAFIAVTVFLVLVQVARESNGALPTEATATVAPTIAPADSHADEAGYHFPAAAEQQFHASFADSPGMGTCILAATEKRYSYNEFVSVSHAYAGTNDQPPSIKAIVMTCALQLQ
jgi:hypothetical protein